MKSPSTRRAWIEIPVSACTHRIGQVTLHPEGVDRNTTAIPLYGERGAVALHPEGVDRNNMAKIDISKIDVALHPEGADRNYDWGVIAQHFEASRPPPKGRG